MSQTIQWRDTVRAKLLLLIPLAVLVVGCDLGTKFWAKGRLVEANIVVSQGILDLTYRENPAGAFSLLQGMNEATRKWLFLLASMLAIGVLLYYLIARVGPKDRWAQAAIALVLGGALGNFYDRIAYGHVVDFIHVHYYDKFDWPVFNMADTFIVAGVGLLLLLSFRKSARLEPEKKTKGRGTRKKKRR